MTGKEKRKSKVKPFQGARVYYSGSIRGVPNPEPDFAYNLVRYMIDGGAEVLSEHVGARTRQEMDEVFLRRTGVDRNKLNEPWYTVRKLDMQWVDEATHLIAILNGPSHRVGMEIERALLRPKIGLKPMPILCLIQESLIDGLSWMVRGISSDECPRFELAPYTDLEDAKRKITDFLTRTL